MRSYGPAHWLGSMICMLLYELDTIHHAVFNKLGTKLPNALHCALPSTLWNTLLIELDCSLPVCSQPAGLALPSKLSRRSQVRYEFAPKYTSEYVLKYTPEQALNDASNCTRWHTPSLLHCRLSSKLSRHFQVLLRVHSPVQPLSILPSTPPSTLSSTLPITLDGNCQPAWLYAPKYTLKREDTPNLTWLYASMYAPACSIESLAEFQAPGTGRCEAGGVWWVVFGGQRVVCGRWQVAGGGVAGGIWWPKSWRRSISYSEPYL